MKREFSFTRFLMATAAIVIIFAGIKLASEIVVPFLLSLFIAIICSPVIRFMTERRIPRWLAISVLFLLIVIVFFLLVGLINNTIHEFTQSIPQYRILLSERLKDLSVIAERFHCRLMFIENKLLSNLTPV